MPLKKSTSEPAFKDNIKAEVTAGKPVKQAVAIAYDVQRAANRGTADHHRGPDKKAKQCR
jgi:hypothetical protein